MRRRFLQNKSLFDINNYCTFEVLSEELIIKTSKQLNYSINGKEWITPAYSLGGYVYTAKKSELISFRYYASSIDGTMFFTSIHGSFNLWGNILSLIFGDEANNNFDISKYSSAFSRLFYNSGVVNISQNFLPATSLGDDCYSQMFAGCSSLLNIPNLPATTFGKKPYTNMFSNCTSLKNITISEGTKVIGEQQFYFCTSLKEVYCKPTTPPTGASFMFSYNAAGRKIYVPRASVNAYKSAYGWSSYDDAIVGYNF